MLDPSSVPVLDRRASNHLGRHPSAARIRRFRTWACLHEKCFGRSHPLTAGIDLIDTHLNRSGAASSLRNSTAPGLSRRDVTGTVRNGKLARADS
jgi:hypothetical protein